jgi:uncharacterized flavoprotein (TIGR03862 family)
VTDPDRPSLSRPASVAIVGAGPAGLFAAERLAGSGLAVAVYDRMPSAGRKFLLAGRGGLNLTHAEPIDAFIERYGTRAAWMDPLIRAFPPQVLRDWCHGLGIPTFVGSSRRIFPEGMKASPLLRAWLARLSALGVIIRRRHEWTGFGADGALAFTTPDGPATVAADAAILALGGVSWPRLGSDGGWVPILEAAGIPVAPLLPANCGFAVAWSPHIADRFAGAPLKRIALSFAGRTVRGEAVLTRTGIEGGAVYALAPALRHALLRDGTALPTLDLKPDMGEAEIAARLAQGSAADSTATRLRRTLGLAGPAYPLLRESASATDLGAPGALARAVKAVPLRLIGTAPIGRAISTAGGIPFEALDDGLMIRDRPGLFAAGEMLDWEAPTGGYLLQACFATGAAAARGVSAWLRRGDSHPAHAVPTPAA